MIISIVIYYGQHQIIKLRILSTIQCLKSWYWFTAYTAYRNYAIAIQKIQLI